MTSMGHKKEIEASSPPELFGACGNPDFLAGLRNCFAAASGEVVEIGRGSSFGFLLAASAGEVRHDRFTRAESPSGNVTACLLGRFLPHAQAIQSDPQAAESIAAIVETGRIDALGLSGGVFVAVAFDCSKRRLSLIRDLSGQRALYYAVLDGGSVFATCMSALLRLGVLSSEPDFAAFADYATTGLVLGDKTLCRSVQIVPPASMVEIREDVRSARVLRYWTPPSGEEISDPAVGLEVVDAALHRAMQRAWAAGGPPAVCLSAGLDSRALMAIADKAGLTADYVTNGVPGSIELKLTERMCRCIGARHIECIFGPDLVENLEGLALDVVRRGEGEAALNDALMAYVAGLYRDIGLTSVVRGHGGELTKLNRAYAFAVPAEMALGRDHSRALEFVYGRTAVAASIVDLDRLAEGPWQAVLAHSPRQSFAQAYRGFQSGVSVGQCVSQLFLSVYPARKTLASMNCLRAASDVAMPYLDADVVAALLSAPIESRLGVQMQVELVARNCPALLDVPNSAMRVPLNASPLRRNVAQFLYRAARKLGYGKADSPERWIEGRMSALFQSVLLDTRTQDRDLMDNKYLSELVNRYSAGEKRHALFLSRLVMLELWLRRFLDAKL